MWPFRKPHAPSPPREWAGPEGFVDWTEDDISLVSQAIRSNGQPESDGFRRCARVALNTMRGGGAVEMVARAIEEAANPGSDADMPILGNHYMHGMPRWCMWVEYARPAVEQIAKGRLK